MFLISSQNSVSTISIFPRNIVIWELSPEGGRFANNSPIVTVTCIYIHFIHIWTDSAIYFVMLILGYPQDKSKYI